VEWTTNQIVISTIKTLKSNEKKIGFAGVDIALDDLPELLESMLQGENDLSFLITSDGSYIYAPETDGVLKNNMFDAKDELSQHMNQILKADGYLNSIIYKDKSYYLISHKMDERGWIIVTLIDSIRIDEQVHSKDMIVFTVLSLGLILMFILVHLLISLTTRPYRLLVDYGKAIANGNISTTIPEKYLIRKDEMGALSNSFQSIINTFRGINLTLEEEIKKKNIELDAQFKVILEQEKHASLGMIVTGIAHEINTPIGSCLSLSTFLLKQAEELKSKFDSGKMTKNDFIKFNEIEYQSLELLNNSLVQASEIIENFKMISVNHNLEKKHVVVLKEILNTAAISMKAEMIKYDHSIKIDCDKKLIIDTYPGALIQVLTHLLFNSINHGFKNKRQGMIWISCLDSGDTLTICYKDNGCGISDESVAKIYEPFFTTSRAEGNSGLGMHIVYTLITQKLNGNILYRQPKETGVEFEIRIKK
jgi:methyl-accepting chemotaxis protein